MDLREEKRRLKDAIAERLSGLPEGKRAAESRSLCRRILDALPPDAKTVCAFMPIGDEVDIRPLLTALLQRGVHLYLPCFEGGLVFRKATTLDGLAPGAFRIPEPAGEADALDPALLDTAIVPGRAFNRKGHRLGRGNGGYDRWIRAQRIANAATRFWGVCYECQLVAQVPMEAHDEPVDAVFTARGKES